jgi:hypothetical protein
MVAWHSSAVIGHPESPPARHSHHGPCNGATMSEEWLQRYYETGNNDELLKIIRHYSRLVDRFLAQCVRDRNIRVEIWLRTVHQLRESRNHPELHFDLTHGPVTGYVFSIVGHLAYRYLVNLEDLSEIS